MNNSFLFMILCGTCSYNGVKISDSVSPNTTTNTILGKCLTQESQKQEIKCKIRLSRLACTMDLPPKPAPGNHH